MSLEPKPRRMRMILLDPDALASIFRSGVVFIADGHTYVVDHGMPPDASVRSVHVDIETGQIALNVESARFDQVFTGFVVQRQSVKLRAYKNTPAADQAIANLLALHGMLGANTYLDALFEATKHGQTTQTTSDS